MSRRLIGATLAFVVCFPLLNLAAPMYNFSSLSGGTLVNLGTTEAVPGLVGTINVSGWYDAAGTWTATDLIARNEGLNERGLGVCSGGEQSAPECANGVTGGGEINELSQQQNNEAILLQRPDNTSWLDLFVSSLDTNSNAAIESGTILLGHLQPHRLRPHHTAADRVFVRCHVRTIASWPCEGSLLLPLSFDALARYVLFVPNIPCVDPEGCVFSNNNDYLVWGATLRESRNGEGDVPVPEPLTLLLVRSGLPGLAYWRKRSRR